MLIFIAWVTKNPFTLGDSSSPGQTEKLQEFSQKLDQVRGPLVGQCVYGPSVNKQEAIHLSLSCHI